MAEDVRRGDFATDARFQYYVPIWQYRSGQPAGLITGTIVRPRGDLRVAAEYLNRELRQSHPELGFVTIRPPDELVDPHLRPWRLGATMLVVFGVLALVTATVGLYSVIAYAVAHRTHEFGIRMALGARSADVLRLVIVEGVGLMAAGLLIGITLVLIGGRFITDLLFMVRPNDLPTLATVSVILLAIACVATTVPALRASRVQPIVALRTE